MPTDKSYTNYIFIEIDLNFEHLKGGEFLIFKVIFLCQKSAEFVSFFSLKNIKLVELLLATLFDYFHF